MKNFNLSQYAIKNLNACSCFMICIILVLAQMTQFYLHELPCPLCLLQRIGFIGIAFGFLLNAYEKPRRFYYFISIVSALFTLSVGLRQVLLHIIPNTGVYGSAIFGLHLYTWSVLIASAVILWITLLLLTNNSQFNDLPQKKPTLSFKILFFLLMAITLTNILTTFAICGFSVCPSDPNHYLWQSNQQAISVTVK
jgi:disulfide bond formation protein DsbB